MTAWVEGRVAGMRRWTDDLHSLQVDAPAVTFVAGQFARLALPAPPGERDPMLGRPYSFVNPPHRAAPRVLFHRASPNGPLSPRLAALGAGDPLWLCPRANGFFSIAEVPAADALWCISTGTGIGPFLSMLRTAEHVGEVRARRARARRCATPASSPTATRSARSRAAQPGSVRVRADGEPRGASGRARRTHSGGDRRRPPRRRAPACRSRPTTRT